MKTTQIAPLRAPQRPLKINNAVLNSALNILSGLMDWSSPAYNTDIKSLLAPVIRFGNDMSWTVFAFSSIGRFND